jgi:hypothetical protein
MKVATLRFAPRVSLSIYRSDQIRYLILSYLILSIYLSLIPSCIYAAPLYSQLATRRATHRAACHVRSALSAHCRRTPSHRHPHFALLPPRALACVSPRWLLPLWLLRSITEDPQLSHRRHRHRHTPRRRHRCRQELTHPPNRRCAGPCRHRSSSPHGRSVTTCMPSPRSAPSSRGCALMLVAQRCGASVRGLAARASPRRTGGCTRRRPSWSVRWRR